MGFEMEMEDMQNDIDLKREAEALKPHAVDLDLHDKLPDGSGMSGIFNDDEGYSEEDYEDDDSIPDPPDLALK